MMRAGEGGITRGAMAGVTGAVRGEGLVLEGVEVRALEGRKGDGTESGAVAAGAVAAMNALADAICGAGML